MDFLLDTNILIHIVRNSFVWEYVRKKYFSKGFKNHAYISAVSIGELKVFAVRNRWGREKVKRLLQLLKTVHALKILDDEVQSAYVNIDTFSQNKHKSLNLPQQFSSKNMGKNDIWIAATAMVEGIPLLSTDRDFEHLDGVFLDFIYINVEEIRNKKA